MKPVKHYVSNPYYASNIYGISTIKMAEGTVQLSSATRAPCSVCHRVMPLTRAGLVRVHGPVGNRCPGSRFPPALSGLSPPSTAPVTAPAPSSPPALPSQNQEPEASCLFGLPHLVKTVKRIPRASRDVAARNLNGRHSSRRYIA